jgi:hypothetical protein
MYKSLEIKSIIMKKLFTSIIFLSIIGLGNLLAQTIVTTDPQLKTVVLEEYTGIHCGYCPDGHVIAGDIQASDPDRVILVNIHAGSYAVPSGGEPDFRTAYGEDLATQAGVTGYPAGAVNRHIFTGNTATSMSRSAWTNAADDILQESTPVNVGLESAWDSVTGELTINVEVYYTNSSNELTNNLHVAILENGLEGPQTDYGPYNAANVLPNGNYVHGHVMRDLITGLNGESISTTAAGSLYTASYTYSVDPTWNIDNCDIVAFVTETQEEILNGTETAANGGSNDGTTVLNIGELSEPILVSGNSYSIDATSFMAGSEDFIFTLTSDAPSNWSSSFDVSGSNYSSQATISMANLASQAIQVNVTAGATPAVATYVLNMESVSNPAAIQKIAEIIVIDGITDLIVNHDQGFGDGAVYDHSDDYTDGLAFAGNSAYGETETQVLFKLANDNKLGDVVNIYYNIGWTFPGMTEDIAMFLAPYLDNGGNLFISGQDMGWDIFENGGSTVTQNFFNDYICGDYVDDGSPARNNVDIVASDVIFGGMSSFAITAAYADPANFYPDNVEPDNSGKAKAIFTYNDGKNGGLRIESWGSHYKIVYLCFDLRSISDVTVRKEVVKISHDWFYGALTTEEFDAKFQSLTAYPNPSKNFATIEFSELDEDATLSIYDIAGKVVYTKQVTSNTNSINIDVTSFETGYYLYNLTTANGNVSQSMTMEVVR